MIKVSQLYAATRGGLDIILHYYPQAAEVVGTKNKFRARPDEKTASAVLQETRTTDGEPVWRVTDFGDEGHALSPVDVAMKMEGIGSFYEAVLHLAAMFDVRDELDRSVNRPEIVRRGATADERDGAVVFRLKERITESTLKVLGPRVSREDAESLGWHEAEWVGRVKNREVVEKHGTEHFPILLRECFLDEKTADGRDRFYKVYEPLNPEKGFRFSYTPEGVKPRHYINGLRELREAYARMNGEREAAFRQDPGNEGRPFREEKLPEAVICSGERDALCARSMGYWPLWFNSETYQLSEQEYRGIMKYVEVLYNIPDLDATGRRKGTELALRFIDVHTAWLPQELARWRDNRGKPRKDLRDWMELHRERKDFQDLLTMARPAKFWTERVNERSGKTEYSVDTDCLLYFLRLNGFHTLKDENSLQPQWVRIEQGVVRRVKPQDLRKFVQDWTQQQCLRRELRNLVLNSSRMSNAILENVGEIDPDFTSAGQDWQTFFFQGGTQVRVSADGIEEVAQGKNGCHVWQENVIDHRWRVLPPMFSTTRREGATGGVRWDVKIEGEVRSCLMGYVINSSRLHWRKEMEERFAEGPDSPEAEAYRESHRFCIDGEGLTLAEVIEQKQCLLNKMFTIGYLLHRFKSPSRAWAPQAMDYKIGANGECNGRSGKSFLFKSLSMMMKSVKLSGRNPKLMDNPHVFDQVSRHTDLVLVDDCDRYFSMRHFYDLITSDLTINPKNNQSITIPYEESPKFAFTTNYVPTDFDASTEARMLYMVYSDYYHQKTDTNDYRETRSIRDDFGRDLFTRQYSEDDWMADINFLLQCTRFYLEAVRDGAKIMPPMENIRLRKHLQDMGEIFAEWAATYFAEESGRLDCFIPAQEAFEECRRECNYGPKYTPNKFTRQLHAFCAITPYVAMLDPEPLRNSGGRIMRRHSGKLVKMLYLRTVKAEQEGLPLNDRVQSDRPPFWP